MLSIIKHNFVVSWLLVESRVKYIGQMAKSALQLQFLYEFKLIPQAFNTEIR